MSIPSDWEYPEWEVEDRVHNWRNYATNELKAHWQYMTDETKKIVAECLAECASAEEWE